MMRLKKFWLKQRKQKIRRFKKYSQQKCLNCKYPLSQFDRFCPRCGQKNSKKKLNLFDLLREFFATLFAYDSRVQQSFKAIFTSPGKIAKEYIIGKRVKYVNPFRFFFFIAVVFFLLVNLLLPYEDIYQYNDKRDGQTGVINKIELNEEGNTSLNDSVSAVNDSLKEDKSLKKIIQDKDLYAYFTENGYQTYDKTRAVFDFEDTFYNWLEYKYLLSTSQIQKQPADFIRFLLPKLPFFIFFFLPFFTLFSKLLYLRREFTYTEHLIFNYYQQSVFLLIFFIDLLIVNFTDYNSATISSIVFLIYHIIAMKYFYEQGYFKTIFKFLILSIAYLTIFTIVISMFIGLSVAFYR